MNRLATSAVALLAATGIVVLTGPATAATAAATADTVTVHTGQTLATVAADAVGVDDWQTDTEMHAPGTTQLLSADGVRLRELNTGPWDDVYRWRTNTFDHDPITDGYGPATPQPWQSWVADSQRMGAQMMVHVNYGSTATDGPGGTDIGPQEAAAWVRQANIVDHDHIRYWVIGEEVWGNGALAPDIPQFEPDHHADKSPTAYGRNVVRFAAAMKAVDPSIKIGVELTPFPDGEFGFPAWNDPVLAAAAGSIDFVDVHSYVFGSPHDDPTLFAGPRQIAPLMTALRGEIAAYAGTRAADIGVVVGETNSSGTDPGTQSVTTPDALFAADDIATWLEQGASTVDWFDSRHGAYPDTTASPDDPTGTGYGTWGLLSDGTDACATDAGGLKACEPPLNTPYPAYYGYGLASRLAAPGARLVATTGPGGPIVTHASVRRDGTVVVLVENEDPTTAHDLTITCADCRTMPVALAYHYGRGDAATSVSIGSARSVHLPPYSMTELVLLPA